MGLLRPESLLIEYRPANLRTIPVVKWGSGRYVVSGKYRATGTLPPSSSPAPQLGRDLPPTHSAFAQPHRHIAPEYSLRPPQCLPIRPPRPHPSRHALPDRLALQFRERRHDVQQEPRHRIRLIGIAVPASRQMNRTPSDTSLWPLIESATTGRASTLCGRWAHSSDSAAYPGIALWSARWRARATIGSVQAHRHLPGTTSRSCDANHGARYSPVRRRGVLLDNVPHDLLGQAVAPDTSAATDGPPHSPILDARRREPQVDRDIDPCRDRYCAHAPALADQVRHHPPAIALLDLLDGQPGKLRAAQRAPEQHCQDRPVALSLDRGCIRRGKQALSCWSVSQLPRRMLSRFAQPRVARPVEPANECCYILRGDWRG
jgi:hypothetical protein